MYQIVEPCPEKIKPPKEHLDFHQDINADQICLEKFFSQKNHSLAQIQPELYPSYESELAQAKLAPNPDSSQLYICPNNRLLQLENQINNLKNILISAPHQHQINWEDKLKQGMDILQQKSQKINDLSAQLEAEILEFKELARKVNQDYQMLQNYQHKSKTSASTSSSPLERSRPANIWEIRSHLIPRVIKQGNQFILTTKPVGEVAADNPENRAKKAQQRQKALESWLEAKRQRIIQDFSRP